MSNSKNCNCNHEFSSASLESCGNCGCKEAKKDATNNQWTTASRASCACEHDEKEK